MNQKHHKDYKSIVFRTSFFKILNWLLHNLHSADIKCQYRDKWKEDDPCCIIHNFKTSLLFLSHCRILNGVPVKSETQKYVSVPSPPPEEFPESMQTRQCQAHTPNLQLLGEEVRISFNISFFYLMCSYTFGLDSLGILEHYWRPQYLLMWTLSLNFSNFKTWITKC